MLFVGLHITNTERVLMKLATEPVMSLGSVVGTATGYGLDD
jgi:hypothetical protein